MRRFVVRRSWQSLLLLLGVSFISFGLVHLAPGGPEVRYEGDPRISPEALAALRTRYGLDQPLLLQFLYWLWNAAQGDFGRSYQSLQPVTGEILRALPNTLILVGSGTFLGLLGIPIGVIIARRRGGRVDNLARILTVAGNAIPHWWLGLLVLLGTSRLAESTGWRVLPLPGYNPAQSNLFFLLWQLILPTLLIALSGWLYYSRLVRSQVLDVVSLDYVRTAHAKGLSEREVNRRHVLPNALLPVITVAGNLLPGIFNGAVIYENIFALPGIGKLSFDALLAYDYPVVTGCLTISAILVILGNFLADLLYSLCDPRISYE